MNSPASDWPVDHGMGVAFFLISRHQLPNPVPADKYFFRMPLVCDIPGPVYVGFEYFGCKDSAVPCT